jgi:hypothetical protein
MKVIAVVAAAPNSLHWDFDRRIEKLLPWKLALQRRDELGLSSAPGRPVEQLWRALQNDLATETPTPGTVVLAAHGGRRIAEQQPALVAAQIKHVVAEARK